MLSCVSGSRRLAQVLAPTGSVAVKFWAGMTGEGITLRVSEQESRKLVPLSTASQTTPRRNYVYGHFDEREVPFYIGKGTGRRAWNDSRHPLWHRYVNSHLNGKYIVKILADDLAPDEAETLEAEWISQESDTLVNWVNFGRETNFAILDHYHALQSANRSLISHARTLEKGLPNEAVALYRQAIENIGAYASLQPEQGMVGQLLDEERAELGISGELVALDRLTLCLVRLGKIAEAAAAADEYFAKYRADEKLQAAAAIKRRVSRHLKSGG